MTSAAGARSVLRPFSLNRSQLVRSDIDDMLC
jgi:hypothetical protein